MALPLKYYDPAFVDCVIHTLTGAQVLFRLMHTWQTHPEMTVVIWCRKGDAIHKSNSIRVALSRERKARDVPRTFQLEFGAVYPYTHNEILGEAINIRRLPGSLLTQMRAVVYHMQIGKLNHD